MENMRISDAHLREHLEKLEQADIPPADDGFYRVALGDGVTLEDHPGIEEIDLFGKLRARVFPKGTSQNFIDSWFYGPHKEPEPPRCPKCGASVRHPICRLTETGMIDLCDQCLTPLGTEVPMTGAALLASINLAAKDLPDVHA